MMQQSNRTLAGILTFVIWAAGSNEEQFKGKKILQVTYSPYQETDWFKTVPWAVHGFKQSELLLQGDSQRPKDQMSKQLLINGQLQIAVSIYLLQMQPNIQMVTTCCYTLGMNNPAMWGYTKNNEQLKLDGQSDSVALCYVCQQNINVYVCFMLKSGAKRVDLRIQLQYQSKN